MNELLSLAHSLAKFVVGAEGNVSMKCDDKVFIKASGTELKTLSRSNVIRFNIRNEQQNNYKKKPSIETSFHAWLLQQSGINFVAHTHPINTTSILCSTTIEEFANNRLFPDHVVFNGARSCVVPYALPGIELLTVIKDSVNLFIENHSYFPKLILLQNHGIICCGSSAKECIIMTEICEKAAQIFLKAKTLNNIQFLTESDIKKIQQDKNEIYRSNLFI